MGKFQVLAISYFVVGTQRSNWCILDLHWSTVPWRKKNVFINSWPLFQTCTCSFKWHFKTVHAPCFCSLDSVLKTMVKNNLVHKQHPCRFKAQMQLVNTRFFTSVFHIVSEHTINSHLYINISNVFFLNPINHMYLLTLKLQQVYNQRLSR